MSDSILYYQQELSKAQDRIAALEAKVERLREAIDDADEAFVQIENWINAYPVDAFIPPTDQQMKDAVAAIKLTGTTSSAIHALWARHILDGLRPLAKQARAALNGEEG